MKTWFVLRWVYQALLAGLHKLYDMILTGTFYLVAETERLWIGVNPETVSLDANNVQAAPLQVRFWAGEGSNKVAMSAYLTFRVESVVGSSVTKLFEDKPVSKVSSYDYTIPSDQYATANRISIYAYEDVARTKEIDSKQVNIIAANPTPFPRSEPWSADLVYMNGEYLMHDDQEGEDEDVLYMWTSRVPGNTEISPKEWIEAHPESGLWTPYPYSTLLAGRIILGKFGMIDSAVFQNGYMISQQGTDASGNITYDYRKFGTKEFTPNLMLDFKRGDCDLVGSIKRGMVIYDSETTPSLLITPKSNIYVVKNAKAQNYVVLYTSSGLRSYGLEFTIINGGSGECLISYITGSLFLFKGKSYGVIKLSKPGDIVDLVFSPVLHGILPEASVAFIIRNKSDFKVASDGVTLESY